MIRNIEKQYVSYFENNIRWCGMFLAKLKIHEYTLFYEQRFFSTQPPRCLILSWIELQMSLKCCLIHITIIIMRNIIYLLYLRPCLHLSLFMSNLRDLFFIFIVIFIMFNCLISWIQTHLLFRLLFRMWPLTFGW